jgi:hypothetical protein
MPFAIGKDILYASILSRIQVQTGMFFTGSTMNAARDDKGTEESSTPPLCNSTESVNPVTLLSPLSPSKKGANALFIGILSPCHPFLKKS